jgi:vacuolar-type H+-ATPase subunit E/Vma4
MELIGDPEELKRAILADAAREAAALEEAAAGEAAAITAAADKEASAEGLALTDAARAEGAGRRAMLLASVDAEAARLRAARLESLLEGVKKNALSLASERARGPELARLAAEAAAGVGGGAVVLSCPPGSGLERFAGEIKKAAGAPELSFEEDPGLAAGVTARSADGSLRWDNGLKARLERLWPELRLELAADLDGGGGHER